MLRECGCTAAVLPVFRGDSKDCLTNFEDVPTDVHVERALYRISTLRDLGFDPYLMIYDKHHAPREIRLLQRWCNNKRIFKTVKDFKDYDYRKC